MKVKDLIALLKAFNPEAEVWTIYDDRPIPGVRPKPADAGDLRDINEPGVDCAVVFRTG